MTKAFDGALRLLSQRDHGMQELIEKLTRKGYSLEDSQQAVADCQRQGLQSDERFVEMVITARIRQGYGPVRISQELRAKHIDPDLINHCISERDEQWEQVIRRVWQKKFTTQDKIDYATLQKQQRFLLYRGFSADMITHLLKHYPVF